MNAEKSKYPVSGIELLIKEQDEHNEHLKVIYRAGLIRGFLHRPELHGSVKIWDFIKTIFKY